MKIMPFLRFEHGVKEGDLSAGRLAGTIASRADRRTKKGTPMLSLSLSDPSGSYEVIGFSEVVEQYGKILQPGRSVILNVEADERPDGISLRLISATPLDEAAQKIGKQLQIETTSDKSLNAIRAQLKPGGNGRVKFIVAREQGKRLYEVDIGGGFQLSPALAGAIKSFEGVVDVRLN
jgi:DNA polymerase-3 subunit alpha